MPRPRPAALSVLLLLACGDNGGGTDTATATAPTTVNPTTVPTSAPTTDLTDSGTGTGTTGGGTGDQTSTTSTTDPTGGPTTDSLKLDVGTPDLGGPNTGGDTGCTAVDLLFVIDNSASMGKHQKNLSAAFPGFVDAMVAALPVGTDLHVGITVTSFFKGNCSESTVNCVSQSSEQEILQHYVPPTDGLTNENGGQGRLFEHDGKHFYAVDTDEDPAGLKTWFSAAATAAGETGCSFEMPAAAAGWAADPATAPTNAGFLRDEGAVLVIFVLTDEPDKSPEPVSQWVDKLVAAKQGCGGKKCIVAAGLVPDFCYDHPGDTTLKTFLESFSAPPITGFIDGDPNDYAMVVGDALAGIIGQTCEQIEPPK